MPGMTKAGYTPEKAPNPPKAPQAPKKQKPKKKKKRRVSPAAAASLAVFGVALAIGVGTLHVFSQVERYQNAFCLGVMLDGHPLGGMTAAEGAALVDQMTENSVASWRYEILCQDRSYVLTAADVGLFIDKQATLEPLWQIGKEGGLVESYVQMLKTQALRVNGQPVLSYSLDKADALIEQIKTETDRSPVDATIHYTPHSSEPFRFTDDAMGYEVDVTQLCSAIEQSILSLTPVREQLVPKELSPGVTRAQLENAITLRARVQMTLAPDAESMENVQIAANMLNGARIEAGDTLSFNALVGKRTKEGGYVTAMEPAYGMGVSGTGGGVCQVSTALYRCALLAGLPVTQRHAAVRPVDYCEMGQEAAVSDTGLDLVIQNPTDSPMFVTTRIYTEEENPVLQLQIIGEPLDVRYALSSSSVETGMTDEPVYMEDKTGIYATYRDERVPGSEAVPGYSVVVERETLDDAGAVLSSERISENTYEAIGPIIYVGTQER